MTQQFLKFDFRKTYNLKDYIVDTSNIQAVKWIDKYPNWKNHGLIIEGPKASGKSHLVRLWQKKSNCNIFSSEEVNRELLLVTNNTTENLETPVVSNLNGFTFDILTDNTNPVGTLKRRFAVAKNKRGVIQLRGESSFSASDQVLIDELIFYIQQNDLKAF